MPLNLDKPLKYFDEMCFEPNLTDKFSKEDLARIGQWCYDGYMRDETSREQWLSRTQAAMELALQVVQGKTFPWVGAANVAFPLVTIAALQFHARAYPTMFAGPDIVKYRVPGIDATGELTANAQLVARYMSHQALDLDESFEEQHDRLLINLPIVGCAFTKTRRDNGKAINRTSLVHARDLVIDYYAKSVDEAARKTHLIPLYRNEIWERCVAGTFRDIREESWYKVPFAVPELPHASERDQTEGKTKPEADESTPVLFGEQHCWIDLDNDGYAEPYIVTFDLANQEVVRIVTRWEDPLDVEKVGNKILRINATESFTKYGLIPSPDGGIYDVGFGILLGPLNESVNTLVNQLIDAGTMSVAAGGFISKGVKIRGGTITFSPFGWQRIESTGDDLSKGIFPLPVREPSAVLFSLLTLLINYTQRISGSGDTMVGENPGQNTPANNMNIMVEQGMQVYSASFKRLWRSMRDEFRKAFILNARHMKPEVQFGSATISRSLFLGDPSLLVPAADPNLVSETQRLQQAVTIKTAAAQTPGYDIGAVERHFLRMLKVDNIDQLYPGPDRVPRGEDPKVTIEKMKMEREQMKLQAAREEFIIEMMEERRLNDAKINQLEAQAAQMIGELEGDAQARALQHFETIIQLHKDRNEAITNRIQALAAMKEAETNAKLANQPQSGGAS